MAKIHDYLSIAYSSSGKFLNGESFVYISNANGKDGIWKKDIKTDENTLVYSSDNKITSLNVNNNEIYFSMDKDGNENYQIFTIKDGENEPVQLTDDYKTVYNIGDFSEDGKTIYASSNKRNKANFDLITIDINTKEEKIILENDDNYNTPKAISPDGRYLLFNKNIGTGNVPLFLLDLEKDINYKVPNNNVVSLYGNPCWLKDSSGFYLITEEHADLRYIAFYDINTQRMETIFEADWEISDIALSPDNNYLSYITNEKGYSGLYILDINNNYIGLNLATPPKGVYCRRDSMAWSKDNKLIFSITSGKRPHDIWIMDVKNDGLFKATNSPMGNINQDDLVEPILKTYRSFDNLEVPYFLYVPKDKAPLQLPVYINIHGGPEGQIVPSLLGGEFIQYLVSQGIAVVAPNVRGSAGYGKKYRDLDNVERRLDSVQDIDYLVKNLIATGIGDKEKISVGGASYGGFMTLSSIARYPEHWCCAVDIVGMFNMVTFLENTSDYRRAHREAEYGTLKDNREMLYEVSPVAKIDNINCPLMIVHGANDPRVPLSEAELAAKTIGNSVPVEMLIYEDEGHGISKLKNKLDAYPKIGDFLKKYMKI